MQDKSPTKSRKTRTSSEVKMRYNSKTYKRYVFDVRLDDPLNEKIKGYSGSLAELIRNLLKSYFDR
jgi:hypothetical protein